VTRIVRQHVNPGSLRYQQIRAAPCAWVSALAPGVPLEVEIGCADAQFSFERAAACPDRAFVGVEIREKVVAFNQRLVETRALDNLHFAYSNVNVDLHVLFPARRVSIFHVLFPDPWFKARHHKRRVMERGLLETISRQLAPGGELHVASDVFEIGLEALAELESAADLGFRNRAGPWCFAREAPVPEQSKREVTTRRRGQRVWRLRYVLEPRGGE
jgi:tRNA (guanine-N7-)-methyltransferase